MSFCGVWKLLWIHFIWSIIGCNQLIPRYAAFHIRAHLGERPRGSESWSGSNIINIFLQNLHKNVIKKLVLVSFLKKSKLSISLDKQPEIIYSLHLFYDRSSRQGVFLEKGVLKICSKFTGEHPCRSVISKKLLKLIHISSKHY